MSGFHLASIGFLGTRGCTALRSGFGLNRPVLQLHPDDPSNYPCQWFLNSTTTTAHCVWCRGSRWGTPSCNDGGVVRQLDTGRNHLIIHELRALGHDLHPQNRRCLLCIIASLADGKAHDEDLQLCLQVYMSPLGSSQTMESPCQDCSARATDQHVYLAREEVVAKWIYHAIGDHLLDVATWIAGSDITVVIHSHNHQALSLSQQIRLYI